MAADKNADVSASAIERILEHDHVDEAHFEDVNRAAALSSDVSELGLKYFLKINVIGGLASISLAVVATFWGFSPPAAVLTFISTDIGDDSGNSSLFSIVWSTCSAIAILLNGRLSDKFGRRYFVIGASIIGLIGGIIACTAKTMNTLIGANVLLGLASGVHSSYALLVGELVPHRYKYLGMMTIVIPNLLPTGFGAYLARMLIETASWRWLYYIYIIIMACALCLQLVFYKPPNFQQLHGARTRMAELKRVDFVGIFLFISGLSMFMLGVSWGGEPSPWTSPKIISLVVIGGCLLIALVFWDLYGNTPNPIVPVRLAKDLRAFVPLLCICGCAGAMYIGTAIIWPSQVARIYGSSLPGWKSAAWLTTTIAFGLISGIIFFGSIFHAVKHVRYTLIFQCVMSTAFIGALASCNRNTLDAAIAFSILGTFPVGVMELTPQLLVQMDSTDADIGACYAFVHCFRTAFGAVMTAVFVAILSNKAPGQIAAKVPPAATAAGLPASSLPALFKAIAAGTADAMSSVPGITAAVEMAVNDALSDAYAAAYAYVYYAVIAIGGVAIIAAFVMKDYDDRLTGHVTKKLYRGDKEEGKVEEKLAATETA